MRLMGNGEGHTVVILTDAESRLIRDALELEVELAEYDRPKPAQALLAFNRGIARGTAKLAEEFAAEQKAKRK
jgi:hypothetical protein